MSRLTVLPAVIAGAIAGGIVGLVAASGTTTTNKTVTTVVRGGGSTSIPTSLSSAQGLSINQIYRQDSPGVVDIVVTSEQPASGSFGFFGGGQQLQEGEGSGVVYDSSGYIVTDQHVIANATKVTVKFWNGQSYSAKVIGSDQSTDVGVIKVDAPASELHPVAFADSSQAQVGDPVVAIGSPFSQPETVTAGIVSQVGRSITAPNGFTITGAIQTDTAINPGNSGGPLLDANGKVLGLNDQIETATQSSTGQGQSSGVGFATPGNTDLQIVNELIGGKRVQHAWVGVSLQSTSTGGAVVPTSPNSGCTYVIQPGSPAARAGLQPGDEIKAIDGKSVSSTAAFISAISGYQPGRTITLTVARAGTTKQLTLTLGERPAKASC